MRTSDRDTFGYRLIQFLKKLNQGHKLDPEEFNVNLSAIQRDLNERFPFFQLEKTNGLYRLEWNHKLLPFNHRLKLNPSPNV